MKPKALLSWSSGKDCAWALHRIRQQNDLNVVGLVTTYNEAFNRVAMHGVQMELVRRQANAANLPVWEIPLPWPCANEIYEQRMSTVLERAKREGIGAFAFGDLYLADIRAYRERQLAGIGIEARFPIWGSAEKTPLLAREMIASGLRAVLVCVDSKQLDPTFAGREFDEKLLADLPSTVDPCGEKGEFHTFCYAGPMLESPIPITVGNRVDRDGFRFAEISMSPFAEGS